MNQATREVKEAVRRLALAQAAPGRTLGEAERAFPDESTCLFDVTVRVFGRIRKRRGEVSIEAVARATHENVEEPEPLGLRLIQGDRDDGKT